MNKSGFFNWKDDREISISILNSEVIDTTGRIKMKVKVGNKIYDGEQEPVMVILSEGDKKNIANMHPDATKYCIYPAEEKWLKDDYKAIKDWMGDV